jgi:NTP pyrophosphatase (non-canonical NTP hydrolase)
MTLSHAAQLYDRAKELTEQALCLKRMEKVTGELADTINEKNNIAAFLILTADAWNHGQTIDEWERTLASEACCDEPLAIRPEVLEFARLMERKLRENDHKGGWEETGKHSLFRMLGEEVDELATAIHNSGNSAKTQEECADVANFAMMISSNCKEQS